MTETYRIFLILCIGIIRSDLQQRQQVKACMAEMSGFIGLVVLCFIACELLNLTVTTTQLRLSHKDSKSPMVWWCMQTTSSCPRFCAGSLWVGLQPSSEHSTGFATPRFIGEADSEGHKGSQVGGLQF